MTISFQKCEDQIRVDSVRDGANGYNKGKIVSGYGIWFMDNDKEFQARSEYFSKIPIYFACLFIRKTSPAKVIKDPLTTESPISAPTGLNPTARGSEARGIARPQQKLTAQGH